MATSTASPRGPTTAITPRSGMARGGFTSRFSWPISSPMPTGATSVGSAIATPTVATGAGTTTGSGSAIGVGSSDSGSGSSIMSASIRAKSPGATASGRRRRERLRGEAGRRRCVDRRGHVDRSGGRAALLEGRRRHRCGGGCRRRRRGGRGEGVDRRGRSRLDHDLERLLGEEATHTAAPLQVGADDVGVGPVLGTDPVEHVVETCSFVAQVSSQGSPSRDRRRSRGRPVRRRTSPARAEGAGRRTTAVRRAARGRRSRRAPGPGPRRRRTCRARPVARRCAVSGSRASWEPSSVRVTAPSRVCSMSGSNVTTGRWPPAARSEQMVGAEPEADRLDERLGVAGGAGALAHDLEDAGEVADRHRLGEEVLQHPLHLGEADPGRGRGRRRPRGRARGASRSASSRPARLSSSGAWRRAISARWVVIDRRAVDDGGAEQPRPWPAARSAPTWRGGRTPAPAPRRAGEQVEVVEDGEDLAGGRLAGGDLTPWTLDAYVPSSSSMLSRVRTGGMTMPSSWAIFRRSAAPGRAGRRRGRGRPGRRGPSPARG